MYISKVRHNEALRIVNGEVQERWSSWEAEVSLTDGEDPKDGALMAENFVNSKQGYVGGDVAGNTKRDVAHKDEETERLWNLVCAKLEAFEFREDAQEYLNTTEFKLTIEAKKLVNTKPLKNK